MDNRDKIISEAAIMFRTYGIRAVTMDMLATHMGISKRTIYEIFRDKEELLHGVVNWMINRRHEMTVKIFNESGNVIEAIFRILDLMLEHFAKMSPAFRLDMIRYHTTMISQIKEIEGMPFYNDNRLILIRGIEEGIFRGDIDIELTNKCLLGVMRISETRNSFPVDEASSEEMIRDFYVNYIRGICTQKGLDLIAFYEKKNKPGSKL